MFKSANLRGWTYYHICNKVIVQEETTVNVASNANNQYRRPISKLYKALVDQLVKGQT